VSVQRNIIIGADAQKFNDAMGEVKGGLGEVSTSTIAMGNIVADVFRDVGRSIVNHFLDARDAALKLPDGISPAVDKAKELRKESELMSQVLGQMMIQNGFEQWVSKWEKASVALASSEFSMWEKVNALFFSDSKAKEMEDWVDEQVDKLNAQLEKANFVEPWLKFGKTMGQVHAENAKAAEAALKASEKLAAQQKVEAEAFAATVAEMRLYNHEAAKMDAIKKKDASEKKENDEWDAFLDGTIEEAIHKVKNAQYELQAGVEAGRTEAERLGDSFKITAGFITTALSNAYGAMGNFIGGLIEMVAQVVAANLAMSSANAVTIGTQTGAATGPLAVFTTPAFIATALGVVASAFAGITKMAHGGIIDKPTTVMAGEAGPEAIIPLHKLGGMGGGNLTTRVSGRDLLIILDRENQIKGRTYG